MGVFICQIQCTLKTCAFIMCKSYFKRKKNVKSVELLLVIKINLEINILKIYMSAHVLTLHKKGDSNSPLFGDKLS